MSELSGYLIKSEFINDYTCPICGQRLFKEEDLGYIYSVCKFCDYADGIAVLNKKQFKIHKKKIII
jgi:hypothetical protein